MNSLVFRIPCVDGDLFHALPRNYEGSSPEPYAFRNGHVKFINTGRYDDYPISIHPTNVRSHVVIHDDTVVHRQPQFDSKPLELQPDVVGMLTYNQVIKGSLNNAFMLHLGSLKPVSKLASRSHMSPFNVAMRERLKDGLPLMEYFEWIYRRVLRHPPESPLALKKFEMTRHQHFCEETVVMGDFNLQRWPHTDFLMRLLGQKLWLFGIEREEIRAVISTLNSTNSSIDGQAKDCPPGGRDDTCTSVTKVAPKYRLVLPGCPSKGKRVPIPPAYEDLLFLNKNDDFHNSSLSDVDIEEESTEPD